MDRATQRDEHTKPQLPFARITAPQVACRLARRTPPHRLGGAGRDTKILLIFQVVVLTTPFTSNHIILPPRGGHLPKPSFPFDNLCLRQSFKDMMLLICGAVYYLFLTCSPEATILLSHALVCSSGAFLELTS